jgi:hypothetical protein
MGGAPGIYGLSAPLWVGNGGRLSADGTGRSRSNHLRFDTHDGRRPCFRRNRRHHALHSSFRSGLGSCSSRRRSARVCCGIFVSWWRLPLWIRFRIRNRTRFRIRIRTPAGGLPNPFAVSCRQKSWGPSARLQSSGSCCSPVCSTVCMEIGVNRVLGPAALHHLLLGVHALVALSN